MRTAVRSLLDRLTVPAEDEAAPVARDGHRLVPFSEFRQRVAAWYQHLAALPEPAVALFEPHALEFAAIMCAGWAAQRRVIAPPDAREDTCAHLAAAAAALVGSAVPAPWRTRATPVDACPTGTDASLPPIDVASAQVQVFTSGTTGEPQLIAKPLPHLLAEVHALESQFGAAMHRCEIVSCVPHQHLYGLLFTILWPLQTGRVFRASSVRTPDALLTTLSSLPADLRAVIVASPAVLKRLSPALAWSNVRHRVAQVFSSGGPLPVDAAHATRQVLGVLPIEVYGSTETGGVAWRQQHAASETAWTPLPGVQVRAEGAQLAIRSPFMPTDAWSLAPDHVRFVAPDAFVLLGRADRIAKIEGQRVSLAAIESTLQRSPAVHAVRVVPLSGPRDHLGAVVVLAPAERPSAATSQDAAEIRRTLEALLLANEIPPIAWPRRWRWVDALPTDAMAKVTTSALLALFAD